MRIAYFLDVPDGLGGAGNLLLQQAGLMSELYDVIVVIPTDDNGNSNQEYEKRCCELNVAHIGMKFYTSYNFFKIDYSEAMESVPFIEEFAKKENIAFFHSVQLNVAVEYVSRKLRIPHLMNIYQLQKNEFNLCPADIYAQYHMCDSKMYSELWQGQLNIKSRCIRPVAIRDEMKSKAICQLKQIKILMMGNVCKRKNQLTAIRAIEQCVLSHKLALHIAGNISNCYGERCISYVEEHGLKEYIHFHGFVSDIVPLLEECDCLLCASTEESFPSSMVEALTYDMTIISTPVAGVPELFVEKYNSFICGDFTVEGIRDSVLECIQYYKNGKIADIHKNAKRTWEECFSRKTVRRQIDQYYKEILRNKHFKSLDVFRVIGNETEQMESQLRGIDVEGETWIYHRGMYYAYLRKKLYGGQAYIWGAGKRGRLALSVFEKLFPDVSIAAFIDTNREGIYCKVPIIKPEEVPIANGNYYCISFAENREAAIYYLEDRGLELYEQIWCMP